MESYRDELSAVLSVSPLSARMAPNDTNDAGTLFVKFPAGAVRRCKVTLFQFTFPLLPSSRSRKIDQCQRCWQFHPVRGCTRPVVCRLCGAKHLEADHPAASTPTTTGAAPCAVDLPKCANCQGPHSPDDSRCSLRPRRTKAGTLEAPSPASRLHLRSLGRRARQRQLASAASVPSTTEDEQSPASDTNMDHEPEPEPKPAPAPPPTSPPREVPPANKTGNRWATVFADL